jgi:hypothetical protein
MGWVFFDSKGNRKESTVNTLSKPMGQIISTTLFSHASSGNWIQLTNANCGFAAAFDTTGTICDPTNGKLVAPVAGRYRITATMGWADANLGERGMQINKNSVAANTNTIIEASGKDLAAITSDLTCTDVVTLAAGDFVSLLVWQNSGGTRTAAGAPRTINFTLEKADDAVLVPIASGAQVLICSQISAGAQTTFDTNTILGGNIPSTYNHLRLHALLRVSTVVTTDPLLLRINNDTGLNYDYEFRLNRGTTPADVNGDAQNEMQVGYATGASDTAGSASSIILDFPFYALSTFRKQVLWQQWAKNVADGTPGNYMALSGGGEWRNTVPITRLLLQGTSAGNFITGSAFYLYGII